MLPGGPAQRLFCHCVFVVAVASGTWTRSAAGGETAGETKVATVQLITVGSGVPAALHVAPPGRKAAAGDALSIVRSPEDELFCVKAEISI